MEVLNMLNMSKIIKIIGIIFFVILNQSCNKNNIIEIVKFDDGQKVISYGENGIIDSIVIEENNVKISKFLPKKKKKNNKLFLVIFLDSKGNVLSKGDMYENNKIGDWLYFKNKRLFKKEEYLRVCNKYLINQTWEYDFKNKINYDKSNFYSYVFIDTLIQKENISKLLKIKFYPFKKIKIDNILFYTSSKIKNNFCGIENLQLVDISKNKKDEYIIAFDKNVKYDTIKGFFVEQFKINNELKEKYTLVKIPFPR